LGFYHLYDNSRTYAGQFSSRFSMRQINFPAHQAATEAGPLGGQFARPAACKGHAQLTRIIWALGDGGTPWGPTPVLMRVWELLAQARQAAGRAN
jgi:hypothetical protein